MPRNMQDYEAEHRSFRWPRPERFNFAVDVVDEHARKRPNELALVVRDDRGRRRAYTWDELHHKSMEAARTLHSLGLRKGDRVLTMLPRIPEWWFLVLGCIRAGIVFMPGTTMLTEKDLRYRLELGEAKAVFVDQGDIAKFEQLQHDPRVQAWVVVGGEGELPGAWQHWHDLIAKSEGTSFELSPTRADDPLLVYFTSGTTGMPKMVGHTQASYGIGHMITGKYWLDLGPEDRHFTLSDTGWAKAAWGSLFGPWSQGATNVVLDTRGRFDAAHLLRVIAEEKVSVFCAPPTAWRAMILQDLSAYDLKSMRHAVSAGEPLNPEVIEAFHRATGLTIREGYGQTETVVIVGSFLAFPPKQGSMGRPSPGFDVRVIDDAGNEVPVNTEGDVAVHLKPERPVGMFARYLNDEEANAVAFRGDWYVTGDRATRDEDGFLWFVGRSDDVIKTSGYRVGPFEVESALLEHPMVAETAVVGVPDERIGQRVKAYVILKPGYSGSPQLATELQEHVKKVTAPYKYPREIEFVAELPKTVSGKIRRNELRKRG